jgi:outer membrane protein, multidrug efflux system
MILRTASRIGTIYLLAFVVVLSGCTVGPNYKRPAVNTPPTFRGAPADANSTASLADQKWTEVFKIRNCRN